MRIVGPIQFLRSCAIFFNIFYLSFIFLGGPKILLVGCIFFDKSRILSKIVLVLLSASVERFFASRMRDFLNIFSLCIFVLWCQLKLTDRVVCSNYTWLNTRFHLIVGVETTSSKTIDCRYIWFRCIYLYILEELTEKKLG